jgi:hypothetical protein
MSFSSFSERIGKLVTNLDKVSLSILEHYISQLTGDKAIETLRAPYDREERLLRFAEILSEVDQELHDIAPKTISLRGETYLKNIVLSIETFEKDLDFSQLERNLLSAFVIVDGSKEELQKYIHEYSIKLRQKFISSSRGVVLERLTADSSIKIYEQLLKWQSESQYKTDQQTVIFEKMLKIFEEHFESDKKLQPVAVVQQKEKKRSKKKLIMTGRKLKVFISYASEDEKQARDIYRTLEKCVEPWLDKEKILPGENWEMAISKAIDESDLMLILISKHVLYKEGFLQKEIRLAHERMMRKPEGDIFIIPLRLDAARLPDSLDKFQGVSVTDDDWNNKLTRAFQRKVEILKEHLADVQFSDKCDNLTILTSALSPANKISGCQDLLSAIMRCEGLSNRDRLVKIGHDMKYPRGLDNEIMPATQDLVKWCLDKNKANRRDELVKTHLFGLEFDGDGFSNAYWDVLAFWLECSEDEKEVESKKEFIKKEIQPRIADDQRNKIQSLLNTDIR